MSRRKKMQENSQANDQQKAQQAKVRKLLDEGDQS